MENEIRNAYDAARNFDNKAFRSACYAPFVSLYFTSLGNVLACCKNETFVLGNVANQRLKEIWNGRKIHTLRQALTNYRFETGCEFCEWQIIEGNLQPAFPSLFEEYPVNSSDPEWPAQIEFAGSNTCNFECIMCDGKLSSSIRAHREGLPPLPKVYTEQFFDDLREFLPHLRRAKFLGGEPFLASETVRIWDMMMDLGLATPCHVTTNGSQYNAKVETILERFPVSLTVSIDGATRSTFETVRVGGSYDQVMKNVYRFREYTKRKKTFFSIAHCLMRQNWKEFIPILLLGEELKCDVFVNTVIAPSYCSLYTLPADEIAHVADEIEKAGRKVEHRLKRNLHVWRENVARLRGKSNEGQAEKIKEIMDTYWNMEDQLSTALRLAREKKFEEALTEARKIQKKDPSYYRAVALCGSILRCLGDFDGAEAELDQALKISSRRPEAFLYRAELRLDQQRLEEALEDALRAQDFIKEGDYVESSLWMLLSYIYYGLGRNSDAHAVLVRLLAMEPDNMEARVQRATVFRDEGFPEKAILEIEMVLAVNPENPGAKKLRAELDQL